MDKKDLVIPLNDLVIGSHCFRSKLEKEFFSGFDEDAVMDASVEVTVNVDKRSSDSVSIVCEVKGEVAVPCDRCLCRLSMPVDFRKSFSVSFCDMADEDTEGEGSEDVVLCGKDSDLDLSQWVYDYVMLSLPLRKVHDESECDPAVLSRIYSGKTDVEEIHNPFAVLKSLYGAGDE